MSAKHLTPGSNLEHLKNQAKRLLKACQAGDPDACMRLREMLPPFSGLSDPEIQSADIALTDAQSVVALEPGFTSWANWGFFCPADLSFLRQAAGHPYLVCRTHPLHSTKGTSNVGH